MNLSKILQTTPNVLLFKYAPIWLSTRYLCFLGKLYYILNRGERNLIKKNINDVFKNHTEAKKIIKKAFNGIFIHYSEKLLMAYRNYNLLEKEVGELISYSGLKYLDNALENGGVLMFTGHFGGVEFMPLALHLRHYPVSMVVVFQTEQLKKNLLARAMSRDVELIDGHEDNVMYEVFSALKRGRIVVTECDEVDEWKTKGNKTINAFGGRIKLDRTLEILCRRSRATVLSSYMVRTGNGYQLTVDRIEKEINAEEPVSIKIFKNFEQIVMEFPDQWYQWKKFHKMRPEIA